MKIGYDSVLRAFINTGQYQALAADERVFANQIKASPDSGPELKAAAQVALDNTPASLHRFLTTGQPAEFAATGRRFLGPELEQAAQLASATSWVTV